MRLRFPSAPLAVVSQASSDRLQALAGAWLPVYPAQMAWLFLRGLALIYLAAFASLAVQIEGLVGADGILPVQSFLAGQGALLGDGKYWKLPTLFWLNASDTALLAACYGGMAAALVLLLNRWNTPALIACFLLYLSLANVGQVFTNFQWDALLLETGFLALFLAGRSRWIVFLYRLLIARFMFMGGVVKIASGDPAWTTLTALKFHYETQPLPTPLAYYAHWLPGWFQVACVAATLVIELAVPFLVFAPRPLRLFAAGSFIALQTGIMLTGNFNFFNLTTVLLCLFLFEDRDLARLLPPRRQARLAFSVAPPHPWASRLSGAWAAAVMATLAGYFWLQATGRYPAAPLRGLLATTSAFSVVNNYGPFAVVTTARQEIVVEASTDGKHWREYSFKYKPDSPAKPLGWNIPHQPRLDWQLWFAALPDPLPRHEEWFGRFLQKLRSGSPPVLALLAYNPFPDRPPAFVRASLYRYAYTRPEERARTAQVWRRENLGRVMAEIHG